MINAVCRCFLLLSWLVFMGLPIGCATVPVAEHIIQDIPQVESVCSKLGVENTWATVDSAWWEVFQDPALNAMIETVMADNSSLNAAWQRLEQSGYAARSARSRLMPQLSVQSYGGWTRQSLGSSGSGTTDSERWGASLAASYEIDLWRKIAASGEQADFAAKAGFYDFETLAISLAAAVCEAWFDVNEQVLLITLLRDQLKTSQANLEVVEARYERGVGSLLDVYQQRQLVAGIRAQIPALEAAVLVARNQLAVLAAVLPGESVDYGEGHLPAPPRPVVADIDSFVVEDRPDVLAALARLGAAERGVARALSERMPSLSISISAGTQADKAAELFDAYEGEALLGITLPLFDGGDRRSEIGRTKAVAAEQLEIYAETVRQAMREIHNARVLELNQQETVKRLEEELTATKATLALSTERYRSGVTDFLNVLTAQSSVYQLERQVISAKRRQLSYRVQFCRSLAGSDVRAHEWKAEQ